MTYNELRHILDQTRDASRRIRMLSMRVQENVQVNQRLTAMYGKERVQGGGPFEDPTLSALVRMDEYAEESRQEFGEAIAQFERGKHMISRMPPGTYRDILTNYYCMGWRQEKIARLMGWKSKSSVRRVLANATDELLRVVGK